MKRCVIFCAAGFDGLLEAIKPGDFVIAADGGLVHAETVGAAPQVILGDFDSLGYVPEGANVFPVEKDDTDAMLAIRQGLGQGCGEFLLYGSLDGRRLDHTVANYQALAYLADRGAAGYLVGRDYIVTVVKDGCLTFPAGCTGTVSVFAMGGRAEGVTLTGLYYPLTDGALDSGFPLGVSNHFTGAEAEISVKCGRLLVFWDRKNGLPRR